MASEVRYRIGRLLCRLGLHKVTYWQAIAFCDRLGCDASDVA